IPQSEVRIQPDGYAMEHDRVLELFGEVLRLYEPRRPVGGKRLRDFRAGAHQTEKALVAGALALVAQHLHQQCAIFLRQLIALIKGVLLPTSLAGEIRQRIACGINTGPEWPHTSSSCAIAAFVVFAAPLVGDGWSIRRHDASSGSLQ